MKIEIPFDVLNELFVRHSNATYPNVDAYQHEDDVVRILREYLKDEEKKKPR